ncbi:nitroreductase/quinone reductase family protein [Nocardia sp. NPDC058658]|uniref:nitroreductase/quinone reductase family protein n=1 Tax=Nocardia sp. NPDC058658 TaxID=3346580 RepID=UPI00364DF643
MSGTRPALSTTGCAANLISARLPAMARGAGRLHERMYRRFGGGPAGKWLGRPIFRLTVVGRTSGQPRSVVLMLVRDGDDLVVCGSNGGNPSAPNWWRNLVAAESGEVQLGRDTWPVAVREITDDAEYERLWAVLVAGYPDFATYRELTERRLPIAVLRRVSPSGGR